MTTLKTRELAEALGVSRQAVNLRARTQSWSTTGQRVRGGGSTYNLESLPLTKDEIRRVNGWLRCREAEKQVAATLPASRREEVSQESTAGQAQPVSKRAQEKMRFKADLLALYNRALATAEWGNKVTARLEFEQAYNSGLGWPHLYEQLGPVSWKTLEAWAMKVRKHGNDCFFLADKRGAHLRGKCGLSEEQTEIFLRCVLRPNSPRISEAYRVARAVMEQKGVQEIQSEATYRRWLQRWKEHNYHLWVFARKGAKAWNDQCAMYLERNMDLLNVGDVIVADGHNLNFEIINPWTGKAQNHMTLILFYDMASNMPLGWEIMPTENTAAISSALRRAVLRLGKYPRVVYLDNGKAFKSRFFRGSKSFDEAGYAGLYERMGCQTIYAWPYHGQSKTVERFFGSFAELERLIPGYTGTSIEDKPPRMMRGEKLHRKIHEQQFGNRCLSLEEAHTLIAYWFDEYARRPQRGHLEGKTPMEVFASGKGPGVDRAELIWLMMSLEEKTIHRNGVTFRGENYYHPALYGRRHKVTIRYDLQDTSSLWILDQQGELLCEATKVEKLHPAAAQLGTEEDKEKLRQHIALKRDQEKQAAASARALLNNEILPAHRRQMAELGVLQDQPELPTPAPKLDLEEQARELAALEVIREEPEIDDYTPELVDESIDLERLSGADLYEALIEREARGLLTSAQQTKMTYYEASPEFAMLKEHFEEYRLKAALMVSQSTGKQQEQER